MIMSSEIHPNMRVIQQNQLSELESNRSATISANNLALARLVVLESTAISTNNSTLARLGIVSAPLESVITSTNDLALATLIVINASLKSATTPSNAPSFAAEWLVGKEDLAPYFKHREGDQYTPAAVALAVITIFIITKSGRDATDSQFLLNLQNIQVSGLNVDQLLDIRQTALSGENVICN